MVRRQIHEPLTRKERLSAAEELTEVEWWGPMKELPECSSYVNLDSHFFRLLPELARRAGAATVLAKLELEWRSGSRGKS